MRIPMLRSFLLLYLWIQLSFAKCPFLESPCKCFTTSLELVAIVCTKAGSLTNALTAMAPAQGLLIDSLSIVDTFIVRLPRNAFWNYSIVRLVLNGNGLRHINDDVFEGRLIDTLLELDMNDNHLSQVPSTAFRRLKALRKLSLNRNQINHLDDSTFASWACRSKLIKLELTGNRLTDSTVNNYVFSHFAHLQQLSLETNSLTAIPIMNLPDLRDLNLGINKIDNVPVGALILPRLESLSLEFNLISDIPPASFRGVSSLRHLYLSGNRLSKWKSEMFLHIGRLRNLGMGEMSITNLPSDAFAFIPRLARLEMSASKVETIEKRVFQAALELQAIVLNGNRLTTIRSETFRGLNQLYSIDLQSNRLKEIEQFGFANLPSIQHLDISNNQLTTMPKSSFQGSFIPESDHRKVLYACGNPWVCDEQLKWFREFLRSSVDLDVDKEKESCTSTCSGGATDCFPPTWPLRSPDPDCKGLIPDIGSRKFAFGWIILATIMAILLTSILLLLLVHYGISRARRKSKDEQRRMATSISNVSSLRRQGINIDLPLAHTLKNLSHCTH